MRRTRVQPTQRLNRSTFIGGPDPAKVAFSLNTLENMCNMDAT